ncbi:MAG: hypothetical protein M3548_16885 [Actinomycetota bacterium]|nr:hypothetical protein [Actinomycetota bacterium]
MSSTPDRAEIIELLASYGDRAPESIGERVDSLELAWLLHALSERYGLTEDLEDDQLLRMSTVDGVLDVMRDSLVVESR